MSPCCGYFSVGCVRRCEGLDSVEAYDPDRVAWQAIPSLLCARIAPGVVMYNRRLIIFAGYEAQAKLPEEVEENDADTQLWKVVHYVEGHCSAVVVSLLRRLWMYRTRCEYLRHCAMSIVLLLAPLFSPVIWMPLSPDVRIARYPHTPPPLEPQTARRHAYTAHNQAAST